MKKCVLDEAECLQIFALDESYELVTIERKSLKIDEVADIYQTFIFRFFSFYYCPKEEKFLPIIFNLTKFTNNEIHEKFGEGIKETKDYLEHKRLYGLNQTELPEKSIMSLLIEEILSPFYIFQAFSVTLWYFEEYRLYANVILFAAILGIVTELYNAKQNMHKLKQMSEFSIKVNVFRCLPQNPLQTPITNLTYYKQIIDSEDLVPGDLIQIPENQTIPCDIILLNGTCVVNESMLSGESIPILKGALGYNNKQFSVEENKQAILFAGTKCIETRYYLKGEVPVLGIVWETGFRTMKGTLIRSIMYPKQTTFQFYQDSLKFIGILVIITGLGLLYSLICQLRLHVKQSQIIDKTLDMITITIPPALPTCMSIGISFAFGRLKKKQIYCIAPSKINVCGKINVMCFDKTGTLTEEGLDTYAIQGVAFQQRSFRGINLQYLLNAKRKEKKQTYSS